MELDKKSIVRRVTSDYLVSETDVDLEEFEVVFDDVYATLERRLREVDSTGDLGDKAGIGFDASMIMASVITVACFVTMRLVEATAKAEIKRLLAQNIDTVERSLVQWTGRPELVRKIRERLERVIDEL